MKAIFRLSENDSDPVNTNTISASLSTSAASVTDMLKKLAEKGFLNYVKYRGVTLTAKGRKYASMLVRKHRLWEVFLADKLNMKWDQIHDIAEQLEHIDSDLLIERLDEFLNFPGFDPHGDPIPDSNGKYRSEAGKPLNTLSSGQSAIISGVIGNDSGLLRMLESNRLLPGTGFSIVSNEEFDGSYLIRFTQSGNEISISEKVAAAILVKTS